MSALVHLPRCVLCEARVPWWCGRGARGAADAEVQSEVWPAVPPSMGGVFSQTRRRVLSVGSHGQLEFLECACGAVTAAEPEVTALACVGEQKHQGP